MITGEGRDPNVAIVVDATCGEMRREVGPVVWVVLEELLLAATVDDASSRAVVSTTIRALAGRIALSKDTVSRSLRRLQATRVLHIEREQHGDSGRFVSVRYIIDLSHLPAGLRINTVSSASPVARPKPAVSRARPTATRQLSMLGD